MYSRTALVQHPHRMHACMQTDMQTDRHADRHAGRQAGTWHENCMQCLRQLSADRRMEQHASRQKGQAGRPTSNNKSTAVRQQDVAGSFSFLSDVERREGVAGQVVQGCCLTLCTIVNLHIVNLPLRKY